jgi:hypothetical protein
VIVEIPCEKCYYKTIPDGGHCYMFRTKPEGICMQHTTVVVGARGRLSQRVNSYTIQHKETTNG